jgi:carbamate kinase
VARRLLVALGGNALLRAGDDGTIGTQIVRADEAMDHIAKLAAAGHELVLTHGNGPVVGNIVLRGEAARSSVQPMPLYIAGADSQGGIGLMLEMSLRNALARAGVGRNVATVVTQMVVQADDPAFSNPSKPIGPYYDSARLAGLRELEPDWAFAETAGRGWRRVVPSPIPKRVVEVITVRILVEAGAIVIAAGGGGVPVIEGENGRLSGVDAVIDKDWASALLAEQVGADTLIVLMEADGLYSGWGTPDQRLVERLTITEADALVAGGTLEPGSIAPKVAAGAAFARATGRAAVLCRAEDLEVALEGRAGTRIEP